MTWTLLLGVFMGALASGWHCALMCSGLATSIERSAPLLPRATLLRAQLLMHTGRITTYVSLGALAGLVGQVFWRSQWLPLQRGLFALAGGLLILMAVQLLRGGTQTESALTRWLRAYFGRYNTRLWRPLARWAAAHSNGTALGYRFLAGSIWGLVPCGLIYGILPLAMLAGDAASGAAVMLAFGLGTLPNLMLISGLSARLAQWGHHRGARWLAAGLMAATGVMAFYRAFSLSPHAGGLCIG